MAIDTDAAQFSRALRNAILLPVAVILAVSALAFLLGYQFLRVVDQSDHSRAVGHQILELHETLLDLETTQLRYGLLGDPVLLQHYNGLLPQTNEQFNKLRELATDNRDLKSAADQLIVAKDMWIQHATGSIGQRQQGKPQDKDWIRLGMTLQENLNRQLAVIAVEQGKVRDERLRDVTHMKRVLILACSALALILALAVGQIVRRQFSRLAQGHRRALHIIQQRHTALLRSETELEQQKEWFRVTLTSIGDGVIVTDKESRVVFMNHEAERLTGWSSLEALMNPLATVFRLIDEQTRVKMEISASEAFRKNKIVGPARQGVLIGRAGNEWPIEETASPIRDGKGEVLGVVLVFHDATAIRQAQAAMREHSDELERAVRERTANLQEAVNQLETFSYTVSHDLRSPLRAMQGFAHLVLEEYGEKIDDQGREYLIRIRNAAERLDRLIQDLLSYTRVARSDAPLIDLDLDRLTRDIVENYPNLRAPAAEVNIEGTLPHVMGQESSLTQVIANLLGNAAKFVATGTVPHIDVRSESRGDRVRLWIEDNGIGVKPQDAERIFAMFVRVNETSRYGGTGVGLAIVKKAVEAMHGTVGVQPGERGGACFWVDLEKGSAAISGALA